eukprot:UC4_evm1s576
MNASSPPFLSSSSRIASSKPSFQSIELQDCNLESNFSLKCESDHTRVNKRRRVQKKKDSPVPTDHVEKNDITNFGSKDLTENADLGLPMVVITADYVDDRHDEANTPLSSLFDLLEEHPPYPKEARDKNKDYIAIDDPTQGTTGQIDKTTETIRCDLKFVLG